MGWMKQPLHRPSILREKFSQYAALGFLLLLAGLALAGPSGVLAWGEYNSTLNKRQAQIAALKEERDVLQNRVGLIDPDRADPDLVSELLRENMNVAHPDEFVMEVSKEP
jgi:cell division protein FtsB